MNDFLQQLLEHELGNRHLDFRQAPGYQERLERISACHDQIRASLGLDFLDSLYDRLPSGRASPHGTAALSSGRMWASAPTGTRGRAGDHKGRPYVLGPPGAPVGAAFVAAPTASPARPEAPRPAWTARHFYSACP